MLHTRLRNQADGRDTFRIALACQKYINVKNVFIETSLQTKECSSPVIPWSAIQYKWMLIIADRRPHVLIVVITGAALGFVIFISSVRVNFLKETGIASLKGTIYKVWIKVSKLMCVGY